MKRFFAFMITLCVFFSCAFAEGFDLSSLSYDELVSLVDQAQRQIMFSDGWQEVEVPPGTYLIGEDIPEGKWTITAKNTHAPEISLFEPDERNKTDPDLRLFNLVYGITLIGTNHSYYSDGKMSSTTMKLQNGQSFSVSNGNVIFTPYKGLGFVFKGQNTEESTQKDDVSSEQVKAEDNLSIVREQLIRELSASLSSANMKAGFEPDTGNVVLDSAVFFETDKFSIKAEGQDLLNRFFPVYLDTLLNGGYADYLDEIVIECYTDTSGSYQDNLILSQDRALQIVLYCMNMPSLSRAQKTKLQEILIAQGRSCSSLVVDANGNEDPEASNRVVFRFSLKGSGTN